jgi:hypothetical protein
MYSLLSLLFGFGLAVLVYGLSFLPAADLTRSEDPDELASLLDNENTNSTVEDSRGLASGRPPERAG